MRLALALLALTGPLSAADAFRSHVDLQREATAAYERRDFPAALKAMQAALELRPDSPRYLHNVAALSALTRDADGALAALRKLAALGVSRPIDRDPDLGALQGTPPFLAIVGQLADNRSQQGEADVFAELPGRTGIYEGIAFRPRTSDVFIGDVQNRCIWRRDVDGRVARFTSDDDELLAIFGIAVDERRNTLWAAMAAVPEMTGYTEDMKGQAGLAEFNLHTSELRRVIPVPGDGRDHGLGDLVVANDGTVYASDSKAPIVWQLAPGAEEMFMLVESPQWISLQGLALVERMLIIADYQNGLFAIDFTRNNAVRAFAPPPNTTLMGIDGLVSLPTGIAAIQNGTEPQRVLKITLAPDLQTIATVTVLAAAQPNMTDLGLATVINDRPTFIAGAGWETSEGPTAKQTRGRTVRIFQAAVP
jgi:sugar lactone lactonase YvrE